MEKRLFLAIAISLLILVGWTKIARMLWPQQFPEQPDKPAVTSTVAPNPSTVTTTTTTTTAAPKAATTTAAPVPAPVATNVIRPAAAATPKSADRVIVSTIDAPEFVAKFSNRGAELISFRLKKFLDKKGQMVELVKARSANQTDFPFEIRTQPQHLALMNLANSALYDVSDRNDRGVRVLEYRFVSRDGFSVTKIFRLNDEFLFKFAIAVSPAIPYRVDIGPGIRTLAPDEIDDRIVITGNALVERDGKLKVFPREKGANVQIFDSFKYVGIEDNYFLALLRPEQGGAAILQRAEFPTAKAGEKRKDFFAAVNATPDGKVSGDSFFGPKDAKVLDKYELEETLQFGWLGIIARFFLDALLWINKYTRNYGFAIIVLTFIIKVFLYPLTHK
ncbi:MAG TPA: membrane protein insertase YidC, partial [Thermoanaerobaculia bacterium]|nr:membrane protein insertase YidC [Thermoanaerobaculia bacterium]